MHEITFIIGGARSGKSAYAQRLAQALPGPVVFIATAQALDNEMRTRIAEHRSRRPSEWTTLEIPVGIAEYALSAARKAGVVVLDCLTLLISNAMLQASPDVDHPDEQAARRLVNQEVESLLRAVQRSSTRWIIVSNEVGQGVVPPYPAGRQFRDLLGWANMEVARQAREVVWMVAGIPVPIGQHRPNGDDQVAFSRG